MSETREPGNPGRAALDWDCSAVIDRVFFFIDNELDQADCSQIQQHLDECGPCLAKYDLERTVKTLVSRSCTEVAPEGLRSRVLLSIRQVQVQITEELSADRATLELNRTPSSRSGFVRFVRRWGACRGSRPSSCGHDACGRSFPSGPPR